MGLFDFIKSILGTDESTSERTGETNVSVEREPESEGIDETDEVEDEHEPGSEEIDEANEVEEPAAGPTDATGSTESILDQGDAANEPAIAAEPAEAAGPESEDIAADAEATGGESESAAPVGESTSEPTDEREPDSEEIDQADEVEGSVAESTDATGSTESILDQDAAASEPAEAAEPSEAAGPESEDMTTDVEETGPDPESAAPAGEGSTVQEIKGIGPAYGERLGEVGIVTVADLADADAEDLTDRTAVSESRLREWIERARDFEE